MVAQSFSFIIPAYNDADGVARHLDYFRIRPEPIQLVIIDDCSTDDTEARVRAADMPDNVEVTYCRLKKNGGPAEARNTGITLASREFVLFLDADDLLTPYFFDYIRLAPMGKGVDFVMFKHHLATEPDQRYSYDMHHTDRAIFTRRPGSFPSPIYRLKDRPGVAATVNFPWNKLYRRQFLLDAEICYPDLRMHEDIAPHWQSFLRCDRFAVLYWAPPLLTHYEVADGRRATNYIGENRMPVFDELRRLQQEIAAHPEVDTISPVFGHFRFHLFHWLTDVLCADGTPDAALWRGRYGEAITALLAEETVEKAADVSGQGMIG